MPTKPPKPPKPPELAEFEESSTGSHVWIDGELVTVNEALAIVKRQLKPESTDPEITPPTEIPAEATPVSKQTLLQWVVYGKPGSLSPLAYVIYGLFTLAGGSLASLGVNHAEHENLATQRELVKQVAACATDESVDELRERVAELTRDAAVRQAGLDAHKAIEAHPQALKRMGKIETDVAVNVAVNLELMKVYHR